MQDDERRTMSNYASVNQDPRDDDDDGLTTQNHEIDIQYEELDHEHDRKSALKYYQSTNDPKSRAVSDIREQAPRFGTDVTPQELEDIEEDYDSMSDLSEELHRDLECWSDDEIDQPRDDTLLVQSHESPTLVSDRGEDERPRMVSVSTYQRKFSRLTSAKSRATTARTNAKLKQEDAPVKGIIFFIIYCFLKTMSYVVCQMLYNREPELKPFPMLFLRSAFGVTIMLIQLNVNVKKETWDTVTKDQVGSLGFKTFTGTTTNMINYSVTKYIPLTIISIISNLAPIIVIVLAFLILKEVIRKFDLVMMLLTLVGIFGVILGGDSENEKSEEDPALPYLVLYILLMINPFLSAGGTIAMRKMKKFGDATVSWYLQWAVLISSAIIMAAQGLSFTIYADFDGWSWFLAFLTGATSVYSETMRFKALKLQKASALQKLIPLTTLFQFVFDVLLFHVHYTWIQDSALGYLCLLYVFQGLKYIYYDARKQAKKEEEREIRKSMLQSTREKALLLANNQEKESFDMGDMGNMGNIHSKVIYEDNSREAQTKRAHSQRI